MLKHVLRTSVVGRSMSVLRSFLTKCVHGVLHGFRLLLCAEADAKDAQEELQERDCEHQRVEHRDLDGVEVREDLEILDLTDKELGNGGVVDIPLEGCGAQLCARHGADEDEADIEQE